LREVRAIPGQYRFAVLISKYGRDEKLFTWIDDLRADCPQARWRRERSVRRAMPTSCTGFDPIGGD